jgi:hypothetical protein
MQSHTNRQPVEDIQAVLGRFQAWAGADVAAKSKDSVREISYEEAVRSSRYRRHVVEELPKSEAFEPAVQQIAAKRTPHSPIGEKRRDAKPKTASKKTYTKAKLPATPVFRQVLEKSVETPVQIARVTPAGIADPRRQVSLSVRLAASDQALIKMRAAEAGISASGYMRQCALEVEQLRKQVEQTLATLQRSAAAPVPIQAPGFFARVRQRLFGPAITGLSLRA